MDNTVKKTLNEGVIIGTLKDKKIEVKTSAKGNTYAMGHLIINTVNAHGIGEIKVKVMQMATKADGTENKLFKALETINNEYQLGETVKVLASLESNDFYLSNEDKVVETIVPKASFITRVDATEEHCAKFKFEGFMKTVVPNEDGSAKVEMVGATYKGDAMPITLEVPQALVNPFAAKYYEGCTATLNFNLINSMVTTESKEEVAFGESFGEVVTRRIRKNEVFGGMPVNEEGMNADTIRQMLNVREMELDKKLQEGRQKSSSAAPSMNVGFGAIPNSFEKPQVVTLENTSNPFGGSNSPF
ncbi:MAG: hypothetical protein RSH78_01285 [Bacilli bacterium]|uniref:hypothetical protein n=1 Tax=Clostridium sp. TaxID=1506 RepID=UPI002FC73149